MVASHEHLNNTDPLERKSLGRPALVLTLLLLIAMAWSLWDEGVSRRPWKQYQSDYTQQVLIKLAQDIAKEEEHLRQHPPTELTAARLREAAKLTKDQPAGKEIARLDQLLAQQEGTIREKRLAIRRVNADKLMLEAGGKPATHPGIIKAVQALKNLDRELAKLELDRAANQTERAKILAPLSLVQADIDRLSAKLRQLKRTRRRIAAAGVEINQYFLPATGQVERCTSCHLASTGERPGLAALPFRRHPGDYLQNHPPERFGCTACHGGYGTALDNLAAPHGFEPSLPRELRQGTSAQGSCISCHRCDQGRDRRLFAGELAGAPALARGLKAFERNLCHGCHITPGFPVGEKLSLPLDRIGAKLSYGEVLAWLEDPRDKQNNARMPRFHLTADGREAKTIASYLFSLPQQKEKPLTWDTFLAKHEDQMSDDELDRLDLILERGTKVWSQVQCADCHRRGDKGGDAQVHAPDLSQIGPRSKRDWLYYHLADPRQSFPESRMPQVNLTPDQIRALVELILRDPEFGNGDPAEEEGQEQTKGQQPGSNPAVITQGKDLVRHLGCAGCHTIPGHELDPLVGNEMTDYGDRRPDQFDFGVVSHIPPTVAAWTRLKLSLPRSFDPALFMPTPHLEPGEDSAITALLLGYTQKEIPRDWCPPQPNPIATAGEVDRIFKTRACLTCHSLGRRGGDYAPELGLQGSRTKSDWLAEFLGEPTSIRPRLVQMPQLFLPAAEIKTLTDFFTLACRNNAWEEMPLAPWPDFDPQLAKGEKNCLACHMIGNQGGFLGPDLQKLNTRLRPGFVYQWLCNPRLFDLDASPLCGTLSPEAAYVHTRQLMSPGKGGGK